MRREDIPAAFLPYAERLDTAQKYVYFRREWILEGKRGNDGRTVVVLFTQSAPGICWHFGAVNYWEDWKRESFTHSEVLFDDTYSCPLFDQLVQQLVHGGALEIADQEHNYSTAHVNDTVGIQINPEQQNWYSLVGPFHHTDDRHYQHIIPILESDMVFGTYLKRAR